MSPIGRVFIILNLILAVAFVAIAGTYLKEQNNFKTKLTEAEVAAVEAEKKLNAEILRLGDSLAESDRLKTSTERDLSNTKNTNADLVAENKTLTDQLSSIEADVKGLRSVHEALQGQVTKAHELSQTANQMAIDAQKAKDAAIREKDDAVANLATANQQIADFERGAENASLQIAQLNQDKNELQLIVDAASVQGFNRLMAVPPLAGTVSHVAGRLLTVSITDNPTSAALKPGIPIAIYEGNTYKGDATVTDADSDRNVVFCRLYTPVTGTEIKVGDKASTKFN